jgi:hypothetical protein
MAHAQRERAGVAGNGDHRRDRDEGTYRLALAATFSAFSLDAALLYERGDHSSLALYILASVGASIVALFAGLYLARGS